MTVWRHDGLSELDHALAYRTIELPILAPVMPHCFVRPAVANQLDVGMILEHDRERIRIQGLRGVTENIWRIDLVRGAEGTPPMHHGPVAWTIKNAGYVVSSPSQAWKCKNCGGHPNLTAVCHWCKEP